MFFTVSWSWKRCTKGVTIWFLVNIQATPLFRLIIFTLNLNHDSSTYILTDLSQFPSSNLRYHHILLFLSLWFPTLTGPIKEELMMRKVYAIFVMDWCPYSYHKSHTGFYPLFLVLNVVGGSKNYLWTRAISLSNYIQNFLGSS